MGSSSFNLINSRFFKLNENNYLFKLNLFKIIIPFKNSKNLLLH